MSNLKVDNIQATGETATRAVSGVAGSWVNFDGTGTIAVRNSANVASLTDNGSGDYTIDWTNTFGAADYAPSGMCSRDGAADRWSYIVTIDSLSTTATRVRVTGENSGTAVAASQDVAIVSTLAHGDLA